MCWIKLILKWMWFNAIKYKKKVIFTIIFSHDCSVTLGMANISLLVQYEISQLLLDRSKFGTNIHCGTFVNRSKFSIVQWNIYISIVWIRTQYSPDAVFNVLVGGEQNLINYLKWCLFHASIRQIIWLAVVAVLTDILRTEWMDRCCWMEGNCTLLNECTEKNKRQG